jgi:mycofactocin precursor
MPETTTPADVETEAPAPAAEEALVEEALVEEALVEEVSIDGMCGVY